MESARLIVDSPAGGPWNMAVDEALLGSAADSRICSLRFYSWNEPILSIGYFQHLADRDQHQASRLCPLVRRPTGGGAIVHDRELTYSLCAPIGDRRAGHVRALYQTVHQGLIEVLQELKITARTWKNGSKSSPQRQPFLCFERRSEGDVVIENWKIAGSAQRRIQGAILQHGSVVLSKSPHAPELPGISDLVGKRIEQAELIRGWTKRISDQLGTQFDASVLSQQELAAAKLCETEKFNSSRWIQRR